MNVNDLLCFFDKYMNMLECVKDVDSLNILTTKIITELNDDLTMDDAIMECNKLLNSEWSERISDVRDLLIYSKEHELRENVI